jgi:hypothetical protein
MNWAGIAKFVRRAGALLPALVLCAAPAAAQYGGPFSPPPNAAGRSQACLRLESQLAAVDRGAAVDPARAEQIKRLEDTAARQQAELDRLGQQSQRMGCQGLGFFALFTGQSPQCGPLNNQVQQARATLDRTIADLQRLQGNSGEREAQRRGVLVALGQNDCGPQYRQYANAGFGGFFDNLFGGSPGTPDGTMAGTYRTVCVRTCDGYYFPISYSTVPTKFADDEQLCRRLCPATEATLYTYRNPGEDISRAVSSGGKNYSELPTAFSYRKQFNAACSCRLPGQSWADALKQGDDQTIERGDIVVTEERARQLSQPRFDAQGKPVNLDPNSGRPTPAKNAKPNVDAPANAAPSPPSGAAGAAAPPAEAKAEEDPSKRKVRAVGPAFYPAR